MSPSTIPTPEELKTMSTKTPRTDAATPLTLEHPLIGEWVIDATPSKVARQLETELLTALAENKVMREAFAGPDMQSASSFR